MSTSMVQGKDWIYAQKIAALPAMHFRHVIRGFDRDLEREYSESYFTSSLNLIRVTLVLSALLVGGFGLLDVWIIPITRDAAWIIRYAVIIPVIAVCCFFTFTSFFRRIIQPVLSFSVLVVGMGFVVMIALIQQSEQGLHLYYVGILQVLIAGYALLRIRFVYASIVGFVLVAGFEVVSIFYNGMLSSPDRIPIFLNNNFFLISSNVMGMLAGYFTEYYLRHTFLLRKRIQYEEELKVETTEHELVQAREELTQTQTLLVSMEQNTDVGLGGMSNTIKSRQESQEQLNRIAIQNMKLLRTSVKDLGNKIPTAVEKTISLVLDRFEQDVRQTLAGKGGQGAGLDLKETKKRIAGLFEKQNLGSIEHFLSGKLRQHAESASSSLDDALHNMYGVMDYIHAIIGYQRGQKVASEEHAFAVLDRVYHSLQYTYKKELADRKIHFSYHNQTESTVMLPVYDFILEEDIMRNLFLNSFRVLVERDPQNNRKDKRIWIEVTEEKNRGKPDNYIIHFRDNGPGVQVEKKKAIFEGHSGRASTLEPGKFGVGCRLVRNRVIEMGGTIVENGKPGEGADFVITVAKPGKVKAESPLVGRTLSSGGE